MAAFEKYTPRTAQLAVKLDSNEHGYGLPPQVQARIMEGAGKLALQRYPDAGQSGLRRRLAAYTGQPEERIVAGNGGDELLQLLACAFRQRCATAVVAPPTFIFFRLAAQLAGLPVSEVPLGDGFAFDAAGLRQVLDGRSWPRQVTDAWAEDGDERLYFICSPNNPTANLCPLLVIEELLERGAWVLVDEAYGEFAGVSVVDLLDAYPRLIILRTLSKAFALAGVRVGYLLAAPAVAGVIDALRQPYNISRFGQLAAQVVLDHRDEMEALWQQIVGQRDHLFQALQAVPGISPYPSHANFILFRVAHRPGGRQAGGRGPLGADGDAAERVWLALREREISIRNVSRKRGLAGHLRVTVGSGDDNQRFLTALRQVMAAGRAGAAGHEEAVSHD